MHEELDPGSRVQRSLFARTLFGRPEMGSAIERIAGAIHDVHFEAGTVIYRQGASSTHIYFILEGKVALEAPGEVAWTFGVRDGFGFQDAMRDRPHARTAIAVTDVYALALSVEDWLDLLDDHSELGRGAILGHAESVRNMIARLAPDGGFVDPGAPAPASESLRRSSLVDRIVMLSESPMFARAGIEAIASFARVTRPELAPAGQVLVRAGQPAGELFVVGAGIVSMERGAPELRARFGPGSIVGGLSVIGLHHMDFTLTAESAALVLRIREDDFFEVVDDHFDFARAVFAHMAGEREGFMRLLSERSPPKQNLQ